MPCKVTIVPHANIMIVIHVLGRISFKMIFEGTSSKA